MKRIYSYLFVICMLMSFGKASARTEYIGPNAVDLGLSVLWGDKNMQDISLQTLYFYWAETSQGGNGISSGNDNYYPGNICGTEFDVASEYYGDGWRMPTANEFRELYEKCNYFCTSEGITFTASNGNSIMLPAVGYEKNDQLANDYTYYWTGSTRGGLFQSWSIYGFKYVNQTEITWSSKIIHTTAPPSSYNYYRRYASDAFGFNSTDIIDKDNICCCLYSNEYQCAIRPVKDINQAYAILNNGVLTFYYDDKKDSHTGTSYEVKKAYPFDAVRIQSLMPAWYADREKINKVIFDTSFSKFSPINTTLWFYDCSKLVDITGFENLNMSNVSEMSSMFNGCTSLTTLDLSSLNTTLVTKMGGIFNDCTKLKTVYVSDQWNTENVTVSGNMFYNCTAIVGGKGTVYSSVHIDKEYAHIDGGVVNPGYLTYDKNATLPNNEPYVEINGNKMYFYYDNRRDKRVGDTYSITVDDTPTWQGKLGEVNDVIFDVSFSEFYPKTTSEWFRMGINIKSITGFENLNTEEVSSMYRMFSQCELLTSLDLDYFVTSNVENMAEMFYLCKKIETLDLSNFDTKEVTDMNSMFGGCWSLKSVRIDNFNTQKVTNMVGMFSACSQLEKLDLSSFNTAKVEGTYYMFHGDKNLATIYVSKMWTTESVTFGSYMFDDCTNLVGGKGTIFDASHIGLDYAHVDGGTNNPGYLTLLTPATSESTQAYAVLKDGKLTFYYDTNRAKRIGTKYTIKNDYYYNPNGSGYGCRYPAWTSIIGNDNVKSAAFDASFADYRPKNTVCWFYLMRNLTSITGMQYLNTSEVTDMSAMFRYCFVLPEVDVTHFDTRNVTNMSFMFCYCFKLAKLDVSKFNTAKVTNMQHMFHRCEPLTSLNVSNFNTTNVTDMSVMFAELYSLPSLDVSGFNTGNVKYMGYMFNECQQLGVIDVSGFNTAKTIDMGVMFSGCRKITSLNLKSFNSACLVGMNDMFSGCSALKTIYASSLWTTSAVTRGEDVFVGCNVLVGGMGTKYDAANVDYDYARIDEGRCSPGYFTGDITSANLGPKEAYAVLDDGVLTFYYDSFKECTDGKVYPIEQDYTYTHLPAWHEDRNEIVTGVFDASFADYRPTNTSFWFYQLSEMTSLNDMVYLKTSEVTKMMSMFEKCEKLTSIDVSYFNTSKVTTMAYMFTQCKLLPKIDVQVFDTRNVTDMSGMFWECKNLNKLDVSGFNTAKVTSMYGMFYRCQNLAVIDVSKFNTANVTNMVAMFMGCEVVENLNVKSFNTAKVTDMHMMFYMCYKLNSLDVSSFNTSNVTNMQSMFDWLKCVKKLDLRNFNTSKVTNMLSMFSGCNMLEEVNVSSFDTRNVTDMTGMFHELKKIKTIDISNFTTKKVELMETMFYDCSELTTIYAGDGWSTASVTDSHGMFYDCPKLVGGAGTKYDSSHTDHEYARIDGGTSRPGYFTIGASCDVNRDGTVDVADIASIIDVMAGHGDAATKKRADVNNDGSVDVADIATVISKMAELARQQRVVDD